MTLAPAPNPSPARRSRKWRWAGGIVLGLALIVALLIAFWNWNWLRPLVEARASVAIGRQVTMGQLEVHLGRTTTLVAHDLHIANPAGFDGPDFATANRLSVTFAAETWLRTRAIVLPVIEVDQPVISAQQTADGKNNWSLSLPEPNPDADPNTPPAAQIGDLIVDGGSAHVVAPHANADITAKIATGTTAAGTPAAGATAPAAATSGTPAHTTPLTLANVERALMIDAQGTYLNQKFTAHAIGGALLTLRDNRHYPIDFTLTSGDTKITLKGTIRDPLNFAGADLTLMLEGQDMAELYALTAIPTPPTPPYHVSGKLDFGHGRFRFTNIQGKVGSSDLNGELEVDPHGARKVLSGTLNSHLVDMDDLAGFIGSQPGRLSTPGQSAQQVADVKHAEADPQLLPTRAISIPKIRSTDVHITYRGDKILGKNMPFDSIAAKLDIVDGHIRMTPLRLGIGGGDLIGNFDLNPVGDELDANADMKIEHVNLAKVLSSAGLGSGQGSIDGTARLKGRGASLAAIVGHGNGAIDVTMPRGGAVNSLLLDLSGLQFGNALISALKVPGKEPIQCVVADFDLQNGILSSRTLVVDTSDHLVTGGGTIDMSKETVQMFLRTDSKHFSIGTLATPIRLSGPFKDMSFAPDPELAVRGGIAIGLGVLFPPAALLPTIQFGVTDKSPCAEPKP
jgi:hypothetical protein